MNSAPFEAESLAQAAQAAQFTEVFQRGELLGERERRPAHGLLLAADNALDVPTPRPSARVKREALEREDDFDGPALLVHAGASVPNRVPMLVFDAELAEQRVAPRARWIDCE